MAPQVEFHPLASDEAVAGQEWYFEIRPDLAEALEVELIRAIERVAASPRRWAPHLHGTRAYMLLRFPYFIVYRQMDDVVQIVAVQHAKQKPGYWVSRIEAD